jgi:Bacterial Ig-like domain (group 1)
VPVAHPRARHAVFIGNAKSVHVKDTIATLERTGSGTPNEVDAIRLHGVFGPFVDVSQTSVRNFTRGVHVEPLDPVPSPRMWLVSETMADGGTLGADAPDTVDQERNYPLHTLVASLSLSPAATTRNVSTQHTITATARDASGLPVKGVNVFFSVSGVNHQSATPVATDANGIAGFSYVGASVGHDTIRAFADSNGNGKQDENEPSTLASVDFVSVAPASISLSQPSGTSPRGAAVTVTATVLTSGGAPVPDAHVVFNVTGANPQGPKAVTTNSAGQAVLTYTGGNAGTDTINAFVDLNANNTRESNEPQATAVTHAVQIVAATIQLLPGNSVVNENAQPTFRATVLDASGAPIPGVVVRFSVTGVNPASASATTNASGTASFQYPGAAKLGTDVVTAFADVNNNNTRDAGEPQAQSTISVLRVQPTTTVVPDLSDLPETMVDDELKPDLALGTVTRLADPPRSGATGVLRGPFVVGQSPAAGALVTRGSKVNITVRRQYGSTL